MKLINVKNLLNAEVGTSESFELNEDISTLDLPEEMIGHNMSLKGRMMRLDDSVVVSVEGSAALNLICDRCLDNFDTKINFKFEQEYMLDRKNQPDDVLCVDKYLNIDLTDELRTEIILAVPTKNICKKNCGGICMGCGVNLNHEECKCNNIKTGLGE